MILIAFISKLVFKNEEIFNLALIIASILGISPIAIQGYQALRVKVVSIDILVTIAVVGAFIIKNYEESAIAYYSYSYWFLLRTAYIKQKLVLQLRN